MKAAARFSADWLALREPFDAAARERSAALVRRLQARRPEDGPWRVIDLGCGTGANLRWLAPRLGGPQQWLVVDRDASLLRRWSAQPGFTRRPDGGLRRDTPGGPVEVRRQRADLAIDTDLDALPWRAAHLITASALLDLAGAAWLQRLAALAATSRAALLFALNVDGRHRWTPADAGDARVAHLFAAHQRRDKGLGPALGPQAAFVFAQHLRERGWRVSLARSDWWIGPGSSPADSGPMQRAMVDGMARAAIEQAPAGAATVTAWQHRRLDAAAHGALRVGHVDLLALPPR
ncbi:MAG: class I SAM-dependent methyltransferase [Hydrogenophaga sp.]|nr:class I SAM-dependent methyltransferase [Hydrogenophaga sp.]